MNQNKKVSNPAHDWINEAAPMAWIERSTLGGLRIATARGPVCEMVAGSDYAREHDARLIVRTLNTQRAMIASLERLANIGDTAASLLRVSNPDEAERFKRDAEIARAAVEAAKEF